jgi:hypothetical protein
MKTIEHPLVIWAELSTMFTSSLLLNSPGQMRPWHLSTAPYPLLRNIAISRAVTIWIPVRSYGASLPPAPSQLKDESDHVRAAGWVKAFEAAGTDAIPEDAYSITMSRSSGPGGQVLNFDFWLVA